MATDLMDDSKFASIVAKALIEGVPMKVKEAGVDLRLVKRFVGDNLVVLLAIIDETDLTQMAKFANEQGYSTSGSCMLHMKCCAEAFGCKRCVQNATKAGAEAALQTKCRDILSEGYFTSKGIQAEVELKNESEQASYFYNKIAELALPGAGAVIPKSQEELNARLCCF